jgi:hypothetical protein
MFELKHASVTHRYIAPVSRKKKPKASASLSETELFPAPAGPSIVTIIGFLITIGSWHDGIDPQEFSNNRLALKTDSSLAPPLSRLLFFSSEHHVQTIFLLSLGIYQFHGKHRCHGDHF